MAHRVFLGGLGLALASGLALSACKGKSNSDAVTVGSAKLPAPIASSLPIDPKIVSAVVNGNGEAPYSGPTGTISGVITISGDPAPDMPEVVASIPTDCESAKDTYGKLFREGPGRTLADVVVAGANRRREWLRLELSHLRAHVRPKLGRAQP
jgi:hypothetical protein